MNSESDMEVVQNYIICTCICIHNIHNIHSSKTNILFHFIYYTDYRCIHACTHQPLVSIRDLKLSWQLYETKSSQGISHAMVEFRNCPLLSVIASWCDDRVYHGYKYSMWPHHLTHQFLMKEGQSLKCWTHIPLHRLIAQDFTKYVSRWQFKAYIYIYIYLPLFGNIHWTRVFFLTHAICIKLQWILFTVNILLNYILLQSKYEGGGGGEGTEGKKKSFLWYYSIGFWWWCMTSEFNDFSDSSHRMNQNLTHHYFSGTGSTPVFRLAFSSLNNYYVVTYMSLKKQAQRQD